MLSPIDFHRALSVDMISSVAAWCPPVAAAVRPAGASASTRGGWAAPTAAGRSTRQGEISRESKIINRIKLLSNRGYILQALRGEADDEGEHALLDQEVVRHLKLNPRKRDS